MKTRLLIIIGIILFFIVIFVAIFGNASDGTPYDVEIQFDAEEYSVNYLIVNGNTNNIEIDIPFDKIDGVFEIYVNDQIVDDERIILDGNKIIINYNQNIKSVKLMGFHDFDEMMSEPEVSNMQCIPTDYEKTKKCLANYHCNVDENPELNKECKETYNGISIREMCSNPDNIIIQKTNGCMILPLVGSKSCGQDFACPKDDTTEKIDDMQEIIIDENKGGNDYGIVTSYGFSYDEYPTTRNLVAVLQSCERWENARAVNFTSPDGTKFAITGVGFEWYNSTHYTDNNICDFIPMKKHIEDSIISSILEYCGSSQKLSYDNPYEYWFANETHYIDADTCLWQSLDDDIALVLPNHWKIVYHE